MKLINTFALTTILTLSTLYGADYKVDSSHSDVGFKVKHMMISSVKGSFENFSGTFSFDEKKKQFSSIEGIVEVKSITTKDAKKYPEMKIKLIKDVTKTY